MRRLLTEGGFETVNIDVIRLSIFYKHEESQKMLIEIDHRACNVIFVTDMRSLGNETDLSFFSDSSLKGQTVENYLSSNRNTTRRSTEKKGRNREKE